MKKFVFGAVCFLISAPDVFAQDQGFTAHLNFIPQNGVPNESYTLLRFTSLKYNTFPSGSIISTANDFAFVAPRAGIVRFSGQIWEILDPTKPVPINPAYVVKISKNAPCGGGDVFAGIGGPASAWWMNVVQVQGEDFAAVGDVYRWCTYATAGVGNTTSIDGNPAHTRIHVSMSFPE